MDVRHSGRLGKAQRAQHPAASWQCRWYRFRASSITTFFSTAHTRRESHFFLVEKTRRKKDAPHALSSAAGPAFRGRSEAASCGPDLDRPSVADRPLPSHPATARVKGVLRSRRLPRRCRASQRHHPSLRAPAKQSPGRYSVVRRSPRFARDDKSILAVAQHPAVGQPPPAWGASRLQCSIAPSRAAFADALFHLVAWRCVELPVIGPHDFGRVWPALYL